MQAWFDYKVLKDLASPQDPIEILCDGSGIAGDRVVNLTCAVPPDADGGVYEVRQLIRMLPPAGFTHNRSFRAQVPDIEVIPVADKNVYPKSLVTRISLDQIQILQDGAERVEYLLDQLAARVDEHSAETKAFRAYLANELLQVGRISEGFAPSTRSPYPKERQNPFSLRTLTGNFKRSS